jgi:glutamate carboxypeptidase
VRAGLLIAGLALAAPAARAEAASLTAVERRVVAAVEAGQADAFQLLQRIVDINSGTMNFDGVRNVGEVLRAEFDGLGFRTRWVDGAPFQRAGHLVAQWEGPKAAATAPKLLLIGHLDTVFEPDHPFQRATRPGVDQYRAPGVNDMKGGDVIMLLALRALRETGLLDGMRLVAVLTGDEEDAGEPLALAREDLFAAGDWADVAIGFEDGDGRFENAVVSRRGASGWRLTAKGAPAHSSLVFRDDTGFGAIYEAARILDEFRRQLAGEEWLTFNPGAIVGGTAAEMAEQEPRGTASGKTNIIASTAIVAGDLRTYTPEQLERTRQRMHEIVGRSLNRTSAEIAFSEGYPPMAPTPGNLRLLALLDRVSQDLGFGPIRPGPPTSPGSPTGSRWRSTASACAGPAATPTSKPPTWPPFRSRRSAPPCSSTGLRNRLYTHR